MGVLGQILYGIGGLGTLICFILVLVQMFQRGQTILAVVCIVLFFCGIGAIIAFIYGWIKHREWGITNIMYAWTGCWVLAIFGVASFSPPHR